MAANIDIKHYDQNGVIKSTFGGMLSSTSISDFNEAVDDRVSALVLSDDALTVTYNDAGGSLTFYSQQAPFQARLTPTTGTAVVTGDVSAVTTIYLTPYKGRLIAVYDGTRARAYVLSADISIKLTDTQTGTLTNGAKTVTGLTDTSQLIVGMKVTGTNVGAAAVISTIDSPTQVTLSVNSTGGGAQSITFKVPATTMLDIFVYVSSGALKLEMAAWTSITSRTPATNIAFYNGFEVSSADSTRRFVGCVYVGATDGQTELTRGTTSNAGSSSADVGGKAYIVNYYNQVDYALEWNELSSHGYTTGAYRVVLANTNAAIRWVSCFGNELAMGTAQCYFSFINATASATSISLDLNGSGINVAVHPFTFASINQVAAVTRSDIVSGVKRMQPRTGLNISQPYEYGGTSNTLNSINCIITVKV